MPEIDDGESAEVKGSARLPYILNNVGGVYSCSCPAWRNQSIGIERRTCKHLRAYHGEKAEQERIGSALPPPASPADTEGKAPALLLAHTWENDIDLAGWHMSEKLDGVFFIDLPAKAEREAIWRLYLDLFELDSSQPRPQDGDWTGAEIRSCCRLAALLDVPLVDAAQNVVPVARTSAEVVERLRSWASGRCLSAEKAGIYQRSRAAPGKPGRKIPRDPSVN